MAIYTVDESQRKAAKIAGCMYLFTLVTANFAEFYARGRLIVSGDAAQTDNNMRRPNGFFDLALLAI